MHRFYTPQLTPEAQDVRIDEGSEVHHARDVLRLGQGAAVELFDGRGLLAAGKITQISAVEIRVKVEALRREPARHPRLTLACAIPKKGKFETIVEKATELGVDEIIPLQTKNSDVVIKPEKAAHKQQRFAQVAVNAAKQCRRATVPLIRPPTAFSEALEMLLQQGPVLIPSLTGDCRPLLTALTGLQDPPQVSILIGPEGDFSVDEYEQAHRSGCLAVTLGPTVLKVETAAITTVAAVRFSGDVKDSSG
ncbi:MAG: 16S rRNA (uracil(1498)-N(3))-methyltransferase [Candidatus Omnitrophica bacterium]|nr:16S rRNA (uracil(1498)-N(3))-methyltransferase [Candidatus Omnitrophota bacterium]